MQLLLGYKMEKQHAGLAKFLAYSLTATTKELWVRESLYGSRS
jgi:hypothetical protein